MTKLENVWADAQKYYEAGGKTAEDKSIVDAIVAARELVEEILLASEDDDEDVADDLD
jgi:hypothetical protein